MKRCSFRTPVGGTLAVIFLSGVSVLAQMPGASTPGMGAALPRLFGDIKAFTAKAEVQVMDGSGKEVASMPMDFALLDTKIRVDMDMTLMRNSAMPPGAATSLKQMGLAQVVSIIRPDKNQVYVVYPDQKSVLNMPLPKEAEAEGKGTKMEKTPVGKETIDGHACVKNKVVMTSEKGQTVEATTWNATDLKDFPIQIETKDQGNTSLMHFKQIQFVKADAKQFDSPAGYTQYNSQQELMQGLMQKMQGAAPGKK